jgi:hypothetical protein
MNEERRRQIFGRQYEFFCVSADGRGLCLGGFYLGTGADLFLCCRQVEQKVYCTHFQ